MDIDPDTATFKDVGRVLKVLDDYALKKLAKYEGNPILPEIITIQRAVRAWIIRTRLQRCVRRGIKFIKGIKAMTRFEQRAEQLSFFYKHDIIYRDDIELKKSKRLKRE